MDTSPESDILDTPVKDDKIEEETTSRDSFLQNHIIVSKLVEDRKILEGRCIKLRKSSRQLNPTYSEPYHNPPVTDKNNPLRRFSVTEPEKNEISCICSCFHNIVSLPPQKLYKILAAHIGSCYFVYKF